MKTITIWQKVNEISHGEDFWDTSNVLFLDLDAGFIGVYSSSLNPLSSIHASVCMIYSQPSIATGFLSMDSINCRSKIFRKKIPETFKKQNLNLPQAEHYNESTQMKWCVGRHCNVQILLVCKLLYHLI